jgi:hypothetical protein
MNRFLLLCSVFIIISCQSDNKGFTSMTNDKISNNLEKISKLHIYFGHQSVGRNIMNGLADLKNENQVKDLNIINLNDSSEVENIPEYYFAHSRIGSNEEPVSKCDSFADILFKYADKLDIALMKFCYVDINENTDVNQMFDYYKSSIDSIQKKCPGLKIVHVTAPLMANSGGWKIKIKRLINYEDYTDPANIKRNEFNELIKKNYKNEPIFDLAAVESTYPDGSRENFTKNGHEYYSLIHDYTYDGGHLNETGRKYAAAELIRVLASIDTVESN